MAQAKRIKKKAARKAKPTSLPWGLIAVVLVSGVILGMLINGVRSGEGSLGSGLKTLFEPTQTQADTAVVQQTQQNSTEKTFEFYERLPEAEKYMPDDLPDAQPTRTPENLDYFLQAGSFKKSADAEKLRARLALKGFVSVTQVSQAANQSPLYRVRLGPYADSRKAKTAKNKLQKIGVYPFIYTVTK